MHIDNWNNKNVSLCQNRLCFGLFFRANCNEVRIHYAVDGGRKQAAVYE